MQSRVLAVLGVQSDTFPIKPRLYECALGFGGVLEDTTLDMISEISTEFESSRQSRPRALRQDKGRTGYMEEDGIDNSMSTSVSFSYFAPLSMKLPQLILEGSAWQR